MELCPGFAPILLNFTEDLVKVPWIGRLSRKQISDNSARPLNVDYDASN